MWALNISSGDYKIGSRVYLKGIPQRVAKEDEDRVRFSGLFMCAEAPELLNGFAVRDLNVKKMPSNSLPEDCSNKNILLKRCGALGDALQTISAAEILKNKFPTCKITLACSKQHTEFARLFPVLDDVINIQDSHQFETIVRSDVILDFFGTVEENNDRSKKDYYDLYKERLGISFQDDAILLPKINTSKLPDISKWKSERNIDKYIVFNVGGSSPMRKWYDENWKMLAYELSEITNYSIIICGCEYDYLFEEPAKNIFCTRGFSILDSVSLVKGAEHVVTTDTGFLHIAGILSKPTLALFGGNTKPKTVTSYYKTVRAVSLNGVCKFDGCYFLSKSLCPFVNIKVKCMNIPVKKVLELLKTSGIQIKQKVDPIKKQIQKVFGKDNIYFNGMSMRLPVEEFQINAPEDSILYITESEQQAYSGGRYYGWMTAKLLANLGFKIYVYTNKLPPFFDDFKHHKYKGSFVVIIDEGLNIDKLNFKCKYVIGEPYNTGYLAYQYGKKHEAIICNYIYETPNYIREYRKGDDANEGFWVQHKEALLNSDIIFPLSTLGKQKLIEWDSAFKDKRIEPLEPTVNEIILNHTRKLLPQLYDRTYDFTFISMNKNYKNLPLFIQALHEFKNIRVAIIGHSVDRVKQDCPIPKDVQVDTFQNCSDLQKFEILWNTKVLVAPSSFEGFGMSLVEAIFTWSNVVATDLPITRLNLGDAPYYFKNNDTFDLVSKMTKAWSDKATKKFPEIMKTMSPIKSRYSNTKYYEKLKTIFKKSTAVVVPLSFKNVALMVPYNEKCGIAENTKYYAQHIPEVTIFAPEGGRIYDSEDKKVVRCWSRDSNDYTQLYKEVIKRDTRVFHFHHEFSFFRGKECTTNFIEFLKKLKMIGTKIIVTYHTYFLDKGVHKAINMYCDKICVCNAECHRLLQSQYNDSRITLTPLPIPTYKSYSTVKARERIKEHFKLNFSNDDFVIGGHGFWQEHKKFEFIVDCLAELKKEIPNIKLLLVGSYDERSVYAATVRHQIKSKGLVENCFVINDYLPLDRIIELLQTCNVVLYPYNVYGYYSGSAAIRTGFAAHIPVMASDSPMFSDLKEVLYKALPLERNLWVKAIKRIYTDGQDGENLIIAKQNSYASNFTELAVAKTHKAIYKNLLQESKKL